MYVAVGAGSVHARPPTTANDEYGGGACEALARRICAGLEHSRPGAPARAQARRLRLLWLGHGADHRHRARPDRQRAGRHGHLASDRPPHRRLADGTDSLAGTAPAPWRLRGGAARAREPSGARPDGEACPYQGRRRCSLAGNARPRCCLCSSASSGCTCGSTTMCRVRRRWSAWGAS